MINKDQLSDIVAAIGEDYIYHFSECEWGEYILIMDKRGLAFARISWYYDDYETIYLDFLSVDKTLRNNRVGTHLQEIRENIGRILKSKYSMLSVIKDSWMHSWYIRRGYKDFKEDQNPNLIWMIKEL